MHPQLTDRGFGSLALQDLCDEARKEGMDWVGAGFGATRELLNFWIKNDFIPVHISPSRNPASGEYSALVVRPLSRRAQKLVEATNNEFRLRLLNSLYDTYSDLEVEVAQLLLRSPYGRKKMELSLSKSQRARLKNYVSGIVTYEVANDAIEKLVKAYFMLGSGERIKLDDIEERLLIAKCLQGRDWSNAARACGFPPSKVKSMVRGIVARLWEGCGVEEAKLRKGV